MSISLNNIESRVTALEKKTNNGIGIGYGQRWYNVTSMRSSNTNYTNTTGQPIMINVVDGSGSNYPKIFVDNIKVAFIAGGPDTDTTLSAIVPSNSTYRVEHRFSLWCELRSNNMYYILLDRFSALFKEVISYVNLLK